MEGQAKQCAIRAGYDRAPCEGWQEAMTERAELRRLLTQAQCPTAGCDGFGNIWPAGNRRQARCKWCDDVDRVLANYQREGDADDS